MNTVVDLLSSFIPSGTMRAVVRIALLLSRAFDTKKTFDWVYGKLPDDLQRGRAKFEKTAKDVENAIKSVWEYKNSPKDSD